MKLVICPLFLLLTVLPISGAAEFEVIQTSRAGDRMTQRSEFEILDSETIRLQVDLEERHQSIVGFGASFTESSAWNLAALSKKSRDELLIRLFSPTAGVGFSLMRTHINSSDYSLSHYSYVDDQDMELRSFSIDEDRKGFSGDENDEVRGIALDDSSFDLLPMIEAARSVPGASFELLASPWSPPSWMKAGEHLEMTGGHLRRDEDESGRRIFWDTWARYLVKYLKSYEAEDVPLWGLTPQNEPGHAKDASWDTCYWSAEDQLVFVRDYLGPQLVEAGMIDVSDLEAGLKLFIFDHNKADLLEFCSTVLSDEKAASYVYGSAFHWYSINLGGVTNYRGEDLVELQKRFPTKALLHSESSIDIHANAPVDQYWDPKNRDWTKGLFTPFSQYAIDMITDLNSGAIGYIDWCVALSRTGGPNPYGNFNSASVLVDPIEKTVTYTPLYYLLGHFSKYVRPGAVRVGLAGNLPDGVHATAMENRDGSLAVVVFNDSVDPMSVEISVGAELVNTVLAGDAIQTILVKRP